MNEQATERKAGNPAKRARTTLICTLISAVFVLFLTLVLLFLVLSDDKTMSENENRMLQQKPLFSLSSVTDGSFMKKFETYLTDQFPLRDKLVGFGAFFSTLVGQRENNGVYFGKNGFLLEAQTPLDPLRLKQTTDAITAFTEKNSALKSALILAPNATGVLKDHLPYGMQVEDQKTQLLSIKESLQGKTISWISVFKSYAAADDPETLYYRTDHHWTTRAAFLAFLSLSSRWHLGAAESDFTFYPVSDSFSGTLAASYGERKMRDVLEICVPKKSKGRFTVTYETQQQVTANVFASDKLQQKNQYEVFLGGNFDKIVIRTTLETENKLLLFKDSYANCLIPMLTPYFSEIVVIDPRYFSDALSDVTDETDFTHVLFLYNLNTFLEDQSLSGVLNS